MNVLGENDSTKKSDTLTLASEPASDDPIQKRLKRIETKVDALFAVIGIISVVWLTQFLSDTLVTRLHWNSDLAFGVALGVAIVAIFWVRRSVDEKVSI